MWSTGAGSDVMKRVAAPMVGGLGTSFLLELLVYPAVYLLWKRRALPVEAPPPLGEAGINAGRSA
jgi:Cu(I)/Ag(I) efflux system membrane protein CusA/SilA